MKNMIDPLLALKQVVGDLERNIKICKKSWLPEKPVRISEILLSPSSYKPHQLLGDSLDRFEARCWLHGATEREEADELERWAFNDLKVPMIAQIKARSVITKWKQCQQDKGDMGAYYADHQNFTIPEPKRGECLLDYLRRLALLFEKQEIKHWVSDRALNSFLSYVRSITPTSETGFIERIFPWKKGLIEERIIRKIAPEAYPLSIEMVRDILVELSRILRVGPSVGQRTAAESLGLCWLCLTASRLRLPVLMKDIFSIKSSSLNLKGPFPAIDIPTLCGEISVRISHALARFLRELAFLSAQKRRKTILQHSLCSRSLDRRLSNVLETVDPQKKFGPVTYISFLSSPHFFGKQRFCSK